MFPEDLLSLDPPGAIGNARYFHTDLEVKTDEELTNELSWLRILNHFVKSGWHRERARRIADELRMRRDARARQRGYRR